MLNLILMAMENPKDEKRFTEIYNKYYNYVYGITSKFFENNMDKEDATYTSLLKTAFNMSKIKDINSNETKGFIAVITRNTCITMVNKKNKIKEVFMEDINDIPDNNNKDFEKIEDEGLLLTTYKKCLTKLTKNQYEVLYLKYVNELSLKEMANILNIKENAIKQRLYGAKQKLSTLIKEELENEWERIKTSINSDGRWNDI